MSDDKTSPPADKPPAQPAAPATVRVRVSDRIAAYGGTFYDRDQAAPTKSRDARNIGATPVEVALTAFVEEKLRTTELVLVKE